MLEKNYTIEDTKDDLVAELPAKKVELAIEGMTCSACSAAVERTTKKLPGVLTASVNLTTNHGTFAYDPSIIKLSEIKSAIEKAGYNPLEIEGEKTRDLEQERRNRDIRIMRIRVTVAAIFSAPILYIALSHMIPALNLPIPYFMGSHDFPFMFALVQFILTVPVMLAGSRFFSVWV
jgi:Cu+-exporting ATPase